MSVKCAFRFHKKHQWAYKKLKQNLLFLYTQHEFFLDKFPQSINDQILKIH